MFSVFLTFPYPCFFFYLIIYSNQVSATRKGFKNQIKNLWWRKGKDEVADLSNGPMYDEQIFYLLWHAYNFLPLLSSFDFYICC